MKNIAVINDLSGFGKCSLSVAIPIISAMGSEVHSLPTAVLSNQTAYNSYHMVDLTSAMPKFIEEWKKLDVKFDAILTGFVCNEKQLDIIDEFINEFKNDDTLLIIDPVMADNGSLYDCYTQQMCEKIKQLCKKADIITPNIAELAYLVDMPYSTNLDDIKKYLSLLNNKTVIVTGFKQDDTIYNIVYNNNKFISCGAKLIGGYYSGTGDIFASIIAGGVLKGMSVIDATKLATDFISKSISSTNNNDPNAGVDFEKYISSLI